ncbi:MULTISPECIES: ABC transporter substrate-binding protein [unclassified Agrococcus]|uniref:ABC transporter substrate-binding protein n=1 Tax=unclassified Agrococcus TaxID=2615065 RepID=UPI003610A310
MRLKHLAAPAAFTIAALALAGCSSSAEADAEVPDVDASTATSAEDFGGLEGLVAAAEAEGTLNVIALPEDWANYGAIMDAFEETYDIEIVSANPEASSAEEITAAEDLAGQDTAPDVFDLGAAVALANEDMFAPYQVETWDSIPEENRHPEGLWVNDYTGIMSVAYDADAVPAPESWEDLLGPDYSGSVALNGDPTQAGAALAGVQLAALQSGGSPDDMQPGIDFFAELSAAGNFLPLNATNATVASGETPVVINWSYIEAANQVALEGQRDWQIWIPEGQALGSYYNQAINADAPHPAAARLWQEFLFSDEAQNIWLEAGAFPVRLQSMIDDGTVDQDALEAVGTPPAELVQLTSEQAEAASALVAEQWATVIQ